jgi:CRISPR-associated endonuclease/helicase Cas3
VNALADGEDAHYAMFLAHGKSHLNDEYNGLKTEPNVGDAGEESAVVNDWFCGRKKGVLADFVVGTVDQLLFMALKARHAALRHLAFAYKAVIIDECHAYDAYMNQYLFRALEWLGQYRTPVVILSATLPGATRRKLIEAYLGTAAKAVPPPAETPVWLKSAQNTAETTETQPKTAQPPAWAARTEYPMITYSDGDAIKQISPLSPRGTKTVRFEYLPDAALPDRLCKMLSNGGCAGVICNTVSRAQEVMRLLAERFAETELELIHARFLGIDRMRKENALRDRLGPPGRAEAAPRPQRLIVVGTQVLEQSLDIDFDLLISDIAPMDLLLQRIGRLHRHARARPAGLKEALCFVTGVEDAAEWRFAPPIEKVYSPYMLLNTLLLLPVAPDRVSLPEDISPLVQAAYEDSDEDDATCAERSDDATARAKLAAAIPPEKRAAYDKAKNAYKGEKQSKEDRADVFRLRPPAGTAYKTLLDWLDIVKEYKGTQKANALNTAASSIKAAGALQKAEASVRDTADSLEVAAVQRKRDGKYCLLPWIGDKNRGVVFGAEIPTERIPDDNVARVAAACTVSLPMQLCGPQIIDKVICELERRAIADRLDTWQESYWLAGLLPLILDENLQAEILGYTVRYCEQTGLSVTRKED